VKYGLWLLAVIVIHSYCYYAVLLRAALRFRGFKQ